MGVPNAPRVPGYLVTLTRPSEGTTFSVMSNGCLQSGLEMQLLTRGRSCDPSMPTALELTRICNLADDYYVVAFDFYKGYECVSNGAAQANFDPVMLNHYLLLHSLEVSLKGWLVLEGDDPDMLRHQYGHDLGLLIDRVIEVYGADALPRGYEQLIKHNLNDNYRGKDYEYPATLRSLVAISPLSEFAKFVESCMRQLAIKIRAKKSTIVP